MSLSVFSHSHFMEKAYQEAVNAYEEDEVPIGAVIVCNNRIIARGYNQTQKLTDVTAHAEMICITAAAQTLGSKYLHDCQLYVTLEPCPMCASALGWAQIGAVYYATPDVKAGFRKVNLDNPKPLLHPKTDLHEGIMAAECKAILQAFFQGKR